jgi:hypothetical protein
VSGRVANKRKRAVAKLSKEEILRQLAEHKVEGRVVFECSECGKRRVGCYTALAAHNASDEHIDRRAFKLSQNNAFLRKAGEIRDEEKEKAASSKKRKRDVRS